MADLAKSILRKLHEAGPTRMDYSKATDEELLELIHKNKDKKAEDAIISRYQKLVAQIGKKYFLKGGGDNDDITQEGLMGVMSAMRSYVPGKNKNFQQFAMMAADRKMKDFVRKATSGKASFLNNAQDLADFEKDQNDYSASGHTAKTAQLKSQGSLSDPYNAVADKQATKRMQDYMNKNLTDWEKSVLSYYLKGYSYGEIAQKVGRNRKAVDNAMNMVRAKMKYYKEKIRDSKIIAILEFIISGESNMARMNEAYNYIFGE